MLWNTTIAVGNNVVHALLSLCSITNALKIAHHLPVMFPGAFQMHIISHKKYEGWYAFREMNGIYMNGSSMEKITIFYQADIGMWAIKIFHSQNIEFRYVAYSAQILSSWPWHF